MKYTKPYLWKLLILAVASFLVILQVNLQAQSNSFCSTQFAAGSIGCDDILHTMNEQGPFHLRIYVHVIRDGNGNGGQTPQDVEEALAYLDEAFNPYDIYFVWDCNIDEISNQDLFDDLIPGEETVFTNPDNNNQADGIDLYLFPDHLSSTTGSGFASIDETALYVAGSYFLPPFGSRVKSHVLSHEMGHCLGLLHTHHFTEGFSQPITDHETVNQSGDDLGNCYYAGDCVCDTPADPNIFLEVNHPSCTWNGYDEDVNDEPFDPSTTNIMSYSHDDCLNEFTTGQGKRMRNVIATLEVLQPCIISQSIEQSSTWNASNTQGGIVEINGSLEIESGVTLTIEAGVEVRFGRASKLIIKPNAKLVLEGTLTSNSCSNTCTITGFCSETWKGVEVWGNSSTHQFTVNGQKSQGWFVGMPGSKIENAEIAVQLWGPNKHTNSGGLINCNQTTFKNNKRGIDFFKFDNYYPDNWPPVYAGKPAKYYGNFIECSFLTDTSYPHQENFTAFVNMIEVNGPTFTGCSFVNTYAPLNLDNITAYGYGIFADDASFRVLAKCNSNYYPCSNFTRSTFQGLGYGVFTGVVINSVDAPFIIRQADFSDCFVGIHNRGVLGGTMLFNDFEMGSLPTQALTTDQIGIALENTLTGMIVEENDFTHTGGTGVHTIGINSFNIGTTNKVIRKNRFNGVAVGCEAGGSCGNDTKGLVFECNTNTNNTGHDFLIYSSGFLGKIKEKQSSIGAGNQVVAVGNQFANSGIPSDRDFANQDGQPIDYHYKMNSGVSETPDEYFGLTNLIPSEENTCPVTYCEPPCKTEDEVAILKEKYYAQKSDYLITRENYLAFLNSGNEPMAVQEKETASKLKQQMDKDAFMVLIHAMYDTIKWDIDTVRIWLENMDDYDAEMMLMTSYENAGQHTEALAVYHRITDKFELTEDQIMDLSNSIKLNKILKGHSIYQLPEHTLKDIEAIAQTNSEYASGRAKNILTYYGWHYPPVYAGYKDKYEKPRAKNQEKTVGNTNKQPLVVYPNPAKNKVTFEKALPLVQNSYLSVTDITGKVYWQQALLGDNSIIEWQTANIPNGLYFYQLISNGTAIDSGKIIIQK